MEELKSKSQKKREADAIQDLGNQLIALSLDDLQTLPLTEPLFLAIRDAKYIKSHGAIRRQSQWVAKLLRANDLDAITTAFEALQAADKSQTAQFHAAELWREKLLDGGNEALAAFVTQYQPEDLQYLRQLIKKAQTATQPLQQKTASTALFRFIRPYV